MDGTAPAVLVGDEEMAKLPAPAQLILPKGEISRRLLALGWSMRGFADENGILEQFLRRLDNGEPLHREELIEQRQRIVRWIEREEKLRAKNPMPFGETGRVSARQRRRRGPRSAAEGVPEGEAPGYGEGLLEGMREAVAWKRGGAQLSDASEVPPAVLTVPGGAEEVAALRAALEEARARPSESVIEAVSDASEVPPGMVRLVLPSPELPSLELADDEPVTGDVVALIVECIGLSPNRIAELMEAPAVARTIRRWIKGRDPIRAESAAWLREVLAVLRAQPPEITAWVRYRYLLQVWRSEASPEDRAVFDALMSLRRPEGLDEWRDAVSEVLRRRPEKLAPYRHRSGGGAWDEQPGTERLEDLVPDYEQGVRRTVGRGRRFVDLTRGEG